MATAATVGVAGSGVAYADAADADAASVTAVETLAALQDTPGVLVDSDTVRTESDTDSAATSTIDGTQVDVPRDPTSGVSMMDIAGDSLTITPPTDGASPATPVASGVTAYPGADGSATAVQATEDGGVRMLTVIGSPTAPQDYTYNVTVPGGGGIVVSADNTASVMDADGSTVATVRAPWAIDASGLQVPTWFTTDGASLTQHVDHQNGAYDYPIKADPWWQTLGNYGRCVLGIGVPIGVAWYFVATVGSRVAFEALKSQRVPAGGPAGVVAKQYATAVWNSCSRFIRS